MVVEEDTNGDGCATKEGCYGAKLSSAATLAAALADYIRLPRGG